MNPTRPALRYHGGKWRLAPWIISHFPPHRIYIEPFGGAASVLLQKPRSYAEVYNDLDDEVVNVFRVLRDGQQAQRLSDALRLTPFSRTEFNSAFENSADPIEQARRTIVKAFAGFGSDAIHRPSPNGMRTAATGYRSDSKRAGGIPAHDWARYPDAIPAFVERLRGVVIECRDALTVIQTHDGDDALHYVDPPYVASTRTTSGRYRHEMTDAQHRSLAELLHSVKGAVVLSGYPSELYDRELYADWRRVTRNALAGGLHRQRNRTEVLWLNPIAISALQPTLFTPAPARGA